MKYYPDYEFSVHESIDGQLEAHWQTGVIVNGGDNTVIERIVKWTARSGVLTSRQAVAHWINFSSNEFHKLVRVETKYSK